MEPREARKPLDSSLLALGQEEATYMQNVVREGRLYTYAVQTGATVADYKQGETWAYYKNENTMTNTLSTEGFG